MDYVAEAYLTTWRGDGGAQHLRRGQTRDGLFFLADSCGNSEGEVIGGWPPHRDFANFYIFPKQVTCMKLA